MTDPVQNPGPADEDETSRLWSELTDELLSLTDKVRATYRRAAEEAGPTEAEVRDAIRTLAGAWNQVAGSVGAAIQDPEVRASLKRAASSLVSAAGASLSEIRPDPAPSKDEVE